MEHRKSVLFRATVAVLGVAVMAGGPPVRAAASLPRGRGRIRLAATPPCESNLTIVVLGSSTAAGYVATPISMSWPNRYATYLKSLSPTNSLVNRAVGGYTTYQIMPTDFAPPAGRPVPTPDRNITYAVSLHPSAIILNLPSNDVASGFTMSETQANYRAIAQVARTAGIPLWITTTQPRNMSADKRAAQTALRDWLKATFGRKCIDFWSPMAAPDGSIQKQFDAGDGIHPNNLGHAVLFRAVVEANIPDVLCNQDVPAVARRAALASANARAVKSLFPAGRPPGVATHGIANARVVALAGTPPG